MPRNTTSIESVWAEKGNQPDNAIVATADGKYPALDGSLITNISGGGGSGDLLAANNLSELTATASVARTNLGLGASATKSETFVNVVDYGANGNDDSDDYTAITLAIAAVTDGGTLYFPPGVYHVSSQINIVKPIKILGPATIKATADIAETAMLVVGDGSTVIVGVKISDIILDGNYLNVAYNPRTALHLIEFSGPLSRVRVENLTLQNANLAGMYVHGVDSNTRGSDFRFNNIDIDNVTEGVKWEFVNNIHWDGGSCTNISVQDGFEPHGGIENFSCRNVYFGQADPSNSAIEVYPSFGDIINGVIENCTIVDDEMRVSLGSGKTVSDFKVSGVTVKNCFFKNSIVYAAVDGLCDSIIFDGNYFDGPSNAITVGGASAINVLDVDSFGNKFINNRIDGYQSSGINNSSKWSTFIGNTISNCGTDTGLSPTQRQGINGAGAQGIYIGNVVFDENGVDAMDYGLRVRGDQAIILGNITNGIPSRSNSISGDNTGYKFLNVIDDSLTTQQTTVTMLAGSSVIGDIEDLFGTNNSNFKNAVAVPLGDMSPATNYRFELIANDWVMTLDSAVTSDCDFRITMLNYGGGSLD